MLDGHQAGKGQSAGQVCDAGPSYLFHVRSDQEAAEGDLRLGNVLVPTHLNSAG